MAVTTYYNRLYLDIDTAKVTVFETTDLYDVTYQDEVYLNHTQTKQIVFSEGDDISHLPENVQAIMNHFWTLQ